jgi:hypothetical protein
MIVRRTYNFRATLVLYCLTGLVVALLIHFIVLSSPRYNWIFPVSNAGTVTTTINPAPGAK